MNTWTRYAAVLAMAISAAWFGRETSYEAALAFLGALTAFIVADLKVLHRVQARLEDEPKKAENESKLLLPRPRLIVHATPDSLENVGVRILMSHRGTISIWVYVHRNGNGIRKLENNRYIFASATDLYHPYKNVFAFSHGPMQYAPPANPAWKLCIVNGKGKGETWTYPDGGEFEVGWHLILVRWDHSAPLIEMLVDGNAIISQTDYLSFWPENYPERAYVGCWPNKSEHHWANTLLSRLRMVPEFVQDDWVKRELRAKPDDPKV